MRFALVDGERREAEQRLVGVCPGCGSAMIPRCGEVRVPHWAHNGRRRCDPWWENETEWHRAWKNRFPADWQEVVQHAKDGEKHIADVKTGADWVIEFQHSYIKPEERRSREAFYEKLFGVVYGTRRIRDEKRFVEAVQNGRTLGRKVKRVYAGEGALFKDWAESDAHIFFDFGGPFLFHLSPKGDGIWAYVAGLSRERFIDLYQPKGGEDVDFDRLERDFAQLVALAKNPPRPPTIVRPKRFPGRHFRL